MTESGQEMCPNTFDEVCLTVIFEKIFKCVSFRVSTVVKSSLFKFLLKLNNFFITHSNFITICSFNSTSGMLLICFIYLVCLRINVNLRVLI